MTPVKPCPRCGKVKPAGEFYHRRSRLSSYCRSCQRAAAEELRAVDRARQRRHRALGGHDPSGGDAA